MLGNPYPYLSGRPSSQATRRRLGYGRSGAVGVILIIILVLVLGRI
jgi:hypothetical protein